MTREFVEQTLEHIAVENFSLFLYGSSALNIFQGRDIDSIVISPDFEEVYLTQFRVHIKQELRICNLYLVPDHIYLNDVYNLNYGGFHSQKFALNFKEISSKGNSLNAPLAFWMNEYKLYRSAENVAHDPESFIRFVHYNILKYNPTFIRPLLKFINNLDRREQLCQYVKHNIFNADLLNDHSISDFIDNTINESREKAFYNYWLEYNKHKDKSSFWGENTFLKMKHSYENINFSLIKQYFRLD